MERLENYDGVGWKDYPDKTTTTSARNFGKMDKGIQDNRNAINEVIDEVTDLDEDVEALNNTLTGKLNKSTLHGGLVEVTFTNGYASYVTNSLYPLVISCAAVGNANEYVHYISNGANGTIGIVNKSTPNFNGKVTFSIMWFDNNYSQ